MIRETEEGRLRRQLRELYDESTKRELRDRDEIVSLKRHVRSLAKRLGIDDPTEEVAPPIVDAQFDRSRTAFVQLGRAGDILNILPVVRDVAIKTGKKPVVVVSEVFANLLDGVSYADAMPVDLFPVDVLPALELAKARFDTVILSQVHGRNHAADHVEESFNRDSWRLAGYGERWSDPSLSLVIDKRNHARERELVRRYMPSADKPTILINCRAAHSSPFVGWEEFQKTVIARWSDSVNWVDVGDITAERLFDLLGLMDLADGLITVDTALLHLAAASDVRVIALAPGISRWRQSTPRCNCVLSVVQEQWHARIDSVHDAIGCMVQRFHQQKVVHVCEWHSGEGERALRAQTTWPTSWETVRYREYARDARSIGDKRDLPFLRDVLAYGLAHCHDDQILVLTNDDTALHCDADEALRSIMRRCVAASSRRIDVVGDVVDWCLKPVDEVMMVDKRHIGRDLFAFRSGWLRRNMHLVPDMVLGVNDWDFVMAALVRVACGSVWRMSNSAHWVEWCELQPGLVIHEAHKPSWMESVLQSPASKHNHALMRSWMADNIAAVERDLIAP